MCLNHQQPFFSLFGLLAGFCILLGDICVELFQGHLRLFRMGVLRLILLSRLCHILDR